MSLGQRNWSPSQKGGQEKGGAWGDTQGGKVDGFSEEGKAQGQDHCLEP